MRNASSSVSKSILLGVILGSALLLQVSCDDAGSEAAVSEPDEPEEMEMLRQKTNPEDIEKAECERPSNTTKELCCSSSLDIDNNLIRCFVLHQRKMPNRTNIDPSALIKYFSCLIECVYKSKKYIGKGNYINMKSVKADAVKMYPDSEEEQDFMVNMYEYCELSSARQLSTFKKNPVARAIFAEACKPYFMLTFFCVMDYNKKVSCPYFKWKGKKDNEAQCDEMRTKCAQLVNK